MNRDTFFAMGCAMTVWSRAPDLSAVAAIFESAENRFSRFRPNSELSRLNRQPNCWVHVSVEMWDVIEIALRLSAETDGLFNPFLLTQLERAGYDRTFDALTDDRTCCGNAFSQNTLPVELDHANRAVRLADHARLDLGGIVKGYTAQQAIQHLRQFGPCLIDAAGDLVAGNAPAGDLGWPVSVGVPFSQERDLLRMWLANRTLATSGIDRRRWQTNAGTKHHIIDPRTGDSAETDLRSVSVWMDDAGSAEAYATAAIVLGLEAAYDLLSERMIGAALVDQFGRLLLTPTLAPFAQIEPDVVVLGRNVDLSAI